MENLISLIKKFGLPEDRQAALYCVIGVTEVQKPVREALDKEIFNYQLKVATPILHVLLEKLETSKLTMEKKFLTEYASDNIHNVVAKSITIEDGDFQGDLSSRFGIPLFRFGDHPTEEVPKFVETVNKAWDGYARLHATKSNDKEDQGFAFELL